MSFSVVKWSFLQSVTLKKYNFGVDIFVQLRYHCSGYVEMLNQCFYIMLFASTSIISTACNKVY